MTNRVVVTGMSVLTSLGCDLASFQRQLTAGRSGVGPITRFDATGYDTRFGAEVKDFDATRYVDRKEARRMDRFTQLAMAGVDMALKDSGLEPEREDPFRCGIIWGTGIGGMETLTDQFGVLAQKGPGRVSPFFVPMMIANMAAGQAAIRHGFKGPNATLVTACASSANSIGEAFRILQRGQADLVVSGGSEAALVPIAVAGFCSMKALSTRNDDPQGASRPFDRERDGFVIGEGSGALVLETLDHARARGARIYAEIVGYGMTADAYHITAPSPEGEGGAMAMRAALKDAGLAPEEVDYINAHGTSTPPGDIAETLAIKGVFGDHASRLAISSTKSMIGHLLGAAGAVEMVASILAINHGVIPPTINYEYPDPDCDLDYVPNEAREASVDVVLSNSFGFGGQNATLIARRFR